MFDKFGEFDSYKELNRVAAAQKAEGDEEALIALAMENGLDKEDAEDYMDGCEAELATVTTAAVGKLKVEKEELKLKGIVEDWQEQIMELCLGNADMAAAVRRKGKTLAGCMAALIKFSFENKVKVSDKIVDVCKVNHNGKLEAMRKPLFMGVPNKTQVKQIVQEYYLGVKR